MIFRNPFPYALIASATAFSFAVAAPAPTEQQLNEFSAAFEKAWKAKDAKAILALHELKELPEGTVDFKAGYWNTLLEMNEQRPKEWGGTEFLSREEGLTEDPVRNVAAYRSQVDDRVVNGRKYAVNLPVVGFLTIYTAGRSGIVTAVGINSEGQLRIVEHAPVNPEAAEYRLPEPIPAQGIAQATPSEKAITQLKEATQKAVASGNFVSLYYTVGVPADLLDKSTRIYNQWENHELAAVDFIPMSTVLEEIKGNACMKEAWKPIQYGNRWYGCNLPIAGRVKISFKSKDKEGWNGSINTFVGLTPEGTLRFVSQTPVIPPTP